MANELELVAVAPATLRAMSNAQLQRLHADFARAWELRELGADLPEGLNREEFLNRFIFVVEEFERRKIDRPSAGRLDGLLAEVRPVPARRESSLAHALDRDACAKFLNVMPDELTIQEDFVRFGGPFLEESDSDGPVEILLQDGFKDSSRDLKLYRIVKSLTRREATFTLCPEGFPSDKLVEGYDLVLRKSTQGHLNVINEPEFQGRIYGSVPPSPGSLQERRQVLVEGLVDFVVVPAFVAITGSFIYHVPDRKPNDIDVVVKSFDEREDIIDLLDKPVREATGLDPHYVWEPRGPNWSWIACYDLVLRARRRSFREADARRSMKVPDPEFLVKRLKQDRETLILSGTSRAGLQDNEWILVNERTKPDQPIRAWAVVSFTQDEKTIPDVAALEDRAAGLDSITRQEFEGREGPFYVLRFKLIDALDPPIELKEPPPGRRFGGVLDLEKARLKEARAIDGLVLVPDAADRVVDGTKEAVVKSRKLDIVDREMFLVASDDALGIIQLGEPRQVGITEFRKLEDVHKVSEEERKRDWPDERTLWIYPIVQFNPFFSPRKLTRPAGSQAVIKNIEAKLVEQMREAFHIRDTHWVPVPASGSCPASHPNKLKFPGTNTLRCFRDSAARVVRMREQEIPKLSNEILNLREKDFPDGRCGLCRYFVGPTTCKIIEGPVAAEQVCDGFQGVEEDFPPYEVQDEDWLKFVKGMIKEQPYQHIVIGGHLTPEGPIVIIRDTFKPKPHIFSLTKDFHIGHTTREHHWTQEEVDGLIREGLEKIQPREAVIQLACSHFFEILNGQAKDMGGDRPLNLEPLLDLPRMAIVQEDRSINQNRAEILRNMKPEDVAARAREMVERLKNSDLVVIVGHAVGKLENRTIFQDQLGFRWQESETDLTEGIRPAFGSTGGKKYLAPTIVRLISDHTKYVEPFIGGGAVFFAKKKSESEVINDKDGDIAHAYRFIQSINDERIRALRKKPVDFSRATFFRLRDSKPDGPLSRFHRFLYLNAFSFGKGMTTTVTEEKAAFGPLTNRIDRMPKIAERLKGVSVLNEDFRSVIRRHDGPKTFFYFDPPYPEQQGKLKTDLTNESIRDALRGIRGKFILSLPDTPGVRKAFKGLHIRGVSVRRTLEMKAEHTDREVLVANFAFKSTTQWLGESVQEEEGVEVHLTEQAKPGKFAQPQKPAFGFREPDGREDAWEEFVKPHLEKDERVSVELKADGIRLLLHRLGGQGSEVQIFTEKKGLERSKFLPALTKAVQELPGGNIILDTETIILKDGKPGIRREFAARLAVQTREPVEDPLRSLVFDILFSDGKDLTGETYGDRLKVLAKRLPRSRGPLVPLERTEVKTEDAFNRAVDRIEKIEGSEGVMIKVLDGPRSVYALETARSLGLAKLKTTTSISALVIGRRKQPAPFEMAGLKEPTEPLTGSRAMQAWRRLIREEQTFIYRAAIRDARGRPIELNARQKYTPDDLQLRWIPAGVVDPLTRRKNTKDRGEWRGTDDPRIWMMARGWPNSREGVYQYAKTFAVRLEPTPAPGKDLIEVEVGELQEWRDSDGKVRYSWTFPAPVETVQEKRPPDTITALRKTARFVSEIQESNPLDASARIVTAGAVLELALWPMGRLEARDLSSLFQEANPGAAVTIDLWKDGEHWGSESYLSTVPGSVPEDRERIRGAKVATLFRNLRGIVGNLEPGQEQQVQPREEGADIFAIAIESEGDAPSRLLRLGTIEFSEVERMAREVAEANPKFRVVIAKVVGKIEGQEVFQAVASFRTQEADIVCANE